MRNLRSIRTIAIALLLTFSLGTQMACDPKQLAKNADRGAKALTQTKPVIQSLIDGGAIPRDKGEQILERLDQGASTFTALAGAFRGGDNTSALDYTEKLVGTVNQLISTDVLLIHDQAKRTLVLAFLSAADIALGIISDNLSKEAAKHPAIARVARGSRPSGANAIEEYAKQPRLRARDSRTGRFVTMDYAKAHSDVTVIERF